MRALSFLACLWLIVASSPLGYCSGSPTTTTLTLSSSSVAAGIPVTMTATVSGALSLVTTGQVTFCEATAAHCDGAAVLGVAQVTRNGTAAITRILGVGSYTIQAVFSGIVGADGGASVPQAVTITGAENYNSETAIAATGSVGNYTLTGTVTVFGKPVASGTVTFLDRSYGRAVASAALNPSTLSTVFDQALGSPLPTNSAQFVVNSDFNADGIPDLAVANTDSGTITVFIGNGDGTFQAPVNYRVGVQPQTIAAADVNGDGNPDLVISNRCADDKCSNGSVSVLLGIGDGTFHSQVAFPTRCFPSFVAIGDFNRDGWPDLAVANNQDNTVSILLGTGDSSLFRPQVPYPTGSNPLGVAIGDFNEDGLLDLAVSNAGDGTLSILLGNGDGTFQTKQTVFLPSSVSPSWLASADLRNIGTIDLVVPDAASSVSVYVLLGNGDGSFQPAVAYPVDAGSDGLLVGDVNGDGILDLVVPNTVNDARISVLLGTGGGSFGVKTDYTVGNNPTFVALADYNGDGLLDIATSNGASSTATILLQARTETAAVNAVALFPAGTHNVLASYPGDNDYASSRSTTIALIGSSQTVTATVLIASPNPAFFGQSVTLTATVIPLPGSPRGTVTFYNGTSPLGSGDLSTSGVASFSTTSLPVGVDNLTASYSGNVAFAPSTSNVIPETIHNVVTPSTFTVTTLETSITVPASGSVNIDVSVLPVEGAFDNVVTMSSAGLPAGATASFNPPSVIPGSFGAPTLLTVQMAAPTSRSVDPSKLFGSMALAIGLCSMGFKRKHSSGRFKQVLRIIFLGSVGSTLIGCAGNGYLIATSAVGPKPASNAGYIVTITGTSGSTQASTNVTLVVQ